MAKVLKEIFSEEDKINQTYTIHSWHVSQSVDALTGVEDYDITISGSLTVTGSVFLDGTPDIGVNTSNILVLDAATNQVKYGVDPSTLGGDAQTGSLLTTASLTGTDLEFTKGDGSTFVIDIATAEAQDLQDVTSLGNRTSSSIQIGPDNDDPNNTLKQGLYYLDLGTSTSTGVTGANIINANSKYNIVVGYTNTVNGQLSGIFGQTNTLEARSSSSLAVGQNNVLGTSIAGGVNRSVAFGFGNTLTGDNSFAQGSNNSASGNNAHAQGSETLASGQYSHAEGESTKATGAGSHAEGKTTLASGLNSHAEGLLTTASAFISHAEGRGSRATGWGAHAEGTGSWASGSFSHTEGIGTEAAQLSNAMGIYTKAYGITTFPAIPRWAESGPYNPLDPEFSGSGQHLFGAQLVIGRYNEPKNDQLFIIGNGTDDNDRTNVMEVSLTDINFFYPLTSSADISSSGDLTINNITASGDISVTNLNVTNAFTASIISASTIIGDVEATAAGNDTEIQFNNGGVFGASSNLTWDNANQVLTIKGGTSTYPSLFLTTVDNDLNKGDIIGRIEAFNTQESGETFNPGLRFVADDDWASGTYNSRIEFQVVDEFAESTQLLISSSGQLKLNSYGNNTFSGTPSSILASDSNGNIIETENTNVLSIPETFTQISIEDYYYSNLNGWEVTKNNGGDPVNNGDISVNNVDPELVTSIKITNRDPSSNLVDPITNITIGSTITLNETSPELIAEYVVTGNKVLGGTPGGVNWYTIPVAIKSFSGTNDFATGNLPIEFDEFEVLNPLNQVVTTGYHRYEISYESNLSNIGGTQVPIRFICDSSNNIGDSTIIEYKGVSTNGNAFDTEFATIQYSTVSGSQENYSIHVNLQTNFSTGSGVASFMTVPSGSSKGFMLLGNNQYP